MEVTISQFRRDLFRLADSAMRGEPVGFSYRGVRFKLVPETETDLFARITPLQVINPHFPDLNPGDLQKEMQAAWEKDWADL